MKLEMLFPISGARTLPVDHAHGLYGALKGISPEIEGIEGFGIHAIRGLPAPGGIIVLDPKRSQLRLRLDAAHIPAVMPLGGRAINVHGSRFFLGVPKLQMLVPSKTLWARIVTLRFEDPGWEAAKATLQTHLLQDYPAVLWEIRKPRTIRIHGKQILGFEVLAKNLTDEDSLRLQSEGFGGRRAFGCGIFVSVGEENRA